MAQMDDFYHLSATLTGYSVAQLQGTGVGQQYLDVLMAIVPHSTLTELFDDFRRLREDDTPAVLETGIQRHILSSPKLGPVARNIIKLWYLSIWYPLPGEWRAHYGQPSQAEERYRDVEFVVSGNAYIQGLVWQTLGSHPMGAKQPGYGTWAEPPDIIASDR